jgi:hypothetical protein
MPTTFLGPASGKTGCCTYVKACTGFVRLRKLFLKKLTAGLLERGWTQSDIDPCLFLRFGMICVVYVDNTIFASANVKDLDAVIVSLCIINSDDQRHTFALRDEGEVSTFIGIQITKTGDNEFFWTQTFFIDKVLSVTNMTNCNGCDTPATVYPLHTDVKGDRFDETWAYHFVIGMLT